VVADGLQRRAADALAQAVEIRRVAEREASEVRSAALTEARAESISILRRVERLRASLESGTLTPEVSAAAREIDDLITSTLVPDESADGGPGESLSHETLLHSVGSDVVLASGARATLLAVDGASATVALGRMRSSIPIAEIQRVLGSATAEIRAPLRPSTTLAVARLDLRGARVEEALAALEERISAVLLAGGDHLEIIHGVGTGALRDAVRRRLRELPEVRDVRASTDPGAEGVTFAQF